MPRQPRFVLEGMPHHVTQRGNYRQNVFESHIDFQKYCSWIVKYSQKYKIEIVAYCLMTNHIHFIVIPKNKTGMSLCFNMVHMIFSIYKNKQKNRKGHLWQGRFYSSPMDEVHFLHGVRYVEQNPVRANLVDQASDYTWSSSRFHLGLEKNPIIRTTGNAHLKFDKNGYCWKDYLGQVNLSMDDTIREKTRKRQIIATEENISSFEEKFGIILRPQKVGRPPRKRN